MLKRLTIFRLWCCHFVSRWLLFPLCYYVVRYRRKVVRKNLRWAFPEKTSAEVKQIEKGFYLAFTDMVLELLVGNHLTEAEMQQLVVINNKEEVAERCKQCGGAFFMLGHFLNWEWMVDYANQFAEYGVECGTVYKRLTNNFFDRLMYKLRSRRGGGLVEMDRLLRVMVKRKNDADLLPAGYAMLADQRPRKKASQYRTTLLHRQVGMLTGTEQLALRFRYPVYYAYYRCKGRGRYEMTLMPLYDPDKDITMESGMITERFTRLLEANIKQEPMRWLWSHNRFAGSTPEATASETLQEI
ncbi:MAG: lysophospholipid acyltransferase family protein [Paludibacter sp.]|nr:lysophospholipid acyltransferase family protein [Bacteroidales bacterium]MCM1068663.1 lysophospholipid acyltransferase family protein [Prevotella sp.]MCM1353327.1 lysophospholipid acyltransferase family protein [Bacteroides sp.]MCM1442265.1 lysophospholipid acyltransferase family protein [Muribaculum sp.]MCM1481084.1 lysophospholipid acyltransferase family protein [Paludibacter sp.]